MVINSPNNFDYHFTISDMEDHHAFSLNENREISFTYNPNTFALDNNNVWFPFDNRGIISDVAAIGRSGRITYLTRYDGTVVIYSAGFVLSGHDHESKLWANGMASASRIEDYQPGIIGSNPSDPANKIYVLRSSHAPFSLSWLEWVDAVNLGADFYDGDGDGTYNPVDLNGNGKWDENEDRPDLVGDITAWCVYNDGVPSNDRAYLNVEPKVRVHPYTKINGIQHIKKYSCVLDFISDKNYIRQFRVFIGII